MADVDILATVLTGTTTGLSAYSIAGGTALDFPYRIEIHEPAGDLLAILRYVKDVEYEESINAASRLVFEIPADEGKGSYIIPPHELWLRDRRTGEIRAKTRLIRKDDIRR